MTLIAPLAAARTMTPPPTTERVLALMARMSGDEKHELAAASTLDVIQVLYARVLDMSPTRLVDPDRDRFLLSKGHGPMAYYAVLAAHGYFSPELLDGFAEYSSPLGHHPDRMLVPGVEISSGSLGHGLPLAVGTAHALDIRGHRGHVYVLVGDAELDEGSNAEAIEHAGGLGMDRLTLIVIDNNSSTRAVRGRIERRLEANGWDAVRIDGRDHQQIEQALTRRSPGRPTAVVAQVEDKA